jgi:hypothetical protein
MVIRHTTNRLPAACAVINAETSAFVVCSSMWRCHLGADVWRLHDGGCDCLNICSMVVLGCSRG